MTKANQDSGIQSVEQLGENIAQLHALRAAQGRSGSFDIAIGPRLRLEYGSRESAEQYLEALAALAAVGVNWAMVEPPHPSRRAYIDNVKWFGEAVIARL